MEAIELRLFAARLQAICDEMGVALRRAAFSPNIKDRLDFSCALFTPDGRLLAQAAHIPVHLGSMAFAMRALVARFTWAPGDVVILNDPFLGGTHLPDVTLVTPVFVPSVEADLVKAGAAPDPDAAAAQPIAFVVNRAHHANIGANEPGSMPVSRTLAEEGVLISPQRLLRAGALEPAVRAPLAAIAGVAADAPDLLAHAALADVRAQLSANEIGKARVQDLFARRALQGDAAAARAGWHAAAAALDAYAERLARAALAQLPQGEASFTELLDDDGQGHADLPISLTLRVSSDGVEVDFDGTIAQVDGNVNCPLSVTAAAVFYVFRCLLPAEAPACAGTFAPVRLTAPLGCLVNARAPAAVAAGNVETSMRIVDALLGALSRLAPARFPAASQGTMNNVAMGARSAPVPGDQGARSAPVPAADEGAPASNRQALPRGRWDYYETIAGGHGASALAPGLSARHAHMTNTLNTPVESLEAHYPLRIRRYARRRDGGGEGRFAGGAGVEKEFEFLANTRVSLLTERRRRGPWGLEGGNAGAPGENLLNGVALGGKAAFDAQAGDRLLLRTPGGGGYGPAAAVVPATRG